MKVGITRFAYPEKRCITIENCEPISNVVDIDEMLVDTIRVLNNNNFKTLSQLLTQKYGSPQFQGTDSVTWKTADTTIELKKLIVGSVIAQTSIRYIPNSKVVVDTSNL